MGDCGGLGQAPTLRARGGAYAALRAFAQGCSRCHGRTIGVEDDAKLLEVRVQEQEQELEREATTLLKLFNGVIGGGSMAGLRKRTERRSCLIKPTECDPLQMIERRW